MEDIYSFLRKLQTQIVAPTSYVDPEANGLLQADSLGPAYQYGDLLKGTPYDTKFSGAMKQVEPGLYSANFQDPGKDKYSTLSAYYRIDPETGMAEMQGDPFQTRQTSKRETVKDFLEHGVPLIAAAVGAGYAVNGLGAAGAAGSGAGELGLSAGAYGGAGALGDAGLLTAAGGSGFAGAGTSTLGSLAGTLGTGAGYGAGIAGGLDALAGVSGYGGTGTLGTIPKGAGTVSNLSTMGTASAPEVSTLAKVGSGATGLLGSASPYLRTAAGLYGAYEGSQEQPGPETAQARQLDPRIDSRVFGPGGLMESADAQFQKNKATGQNETMVQAQDWLRGLLTSPEMAQGLRSQYNASQGLFNMGPNPFKWGG